MNVSVTIIYNVSNQLVLIPYSSIQPQFNVTDIAAGDSGSLQLFPNRNVLIESIRVNDSILSNIRAAGLVATIERQVPVGNPGVAINDTSVSWPLISSDTVEATFEVSLSFIPAATVQISYTTSDLTGTAGVDYIATSDTITFLPGQTSRDITVTVLPGSSNNDTFAVLLLNPVNCTILDSIGICIIERTTENLTIIPPSIISGAFGDFVIHQFITASSVNSAEAFGSHIVEYEQQTIIPSAITTLEAFGTASVAGGTVQISPVALSSAEEFGSVVVSGDAVIIVPTAISSLEAFGTATISVGTVTIVPTAIASLEAFGTATVVSDGTVIPTGIASQEAFGTAELAVNPVMLYSDGYMIGNRPTTANWLETSGICNSQLEANYGHIWCQSDGSVEILFALQSSDSATHGEFTLTSASAVDLEDIDSATVDGQPYIYLADTGNNGGGANSRGSGIDCRIYRVEEPTIYTPPTPSDYPFGTELILYHFENDGSTVVNSGTGGATYDSVFTGNATYTTTSFFGTHAYVGDGNSDAVDTGFGNGRNPFSAPFTISCWARRNGTGSGADQHLFGVANTATNQRWYCRMRNATGSAGVAQAWGMRVQGSASVESNVQVTLNTWFHVCMVADSGTARLYINGVERATSSYTSFTLANTIACGTNKENGVLTITEGWDGEIDDFAVYTSALSPADVAEIFNAGSEGGYFGGSLSPSTDYITISCAFPAANVPSHRDCECIIADPDNGDIYFVTKRITPAQVYRLPHAASYTGTQTLEYMGTIWTPPFSVDGVNSANGGYIVGGSINKDGSVLALKNYYNIYLFNRTSNQTIFEALQQPGQALPAYVGGTRPCAYPNNEVKGEAVCFDEHDRIFTASEYEAALSNGTYNPTFRYEKNYKPATSLSLQEGIDSYAGTHDTYIDAAAGQQSTSHASDTTLTASYVSSTDQRFVLIKFDLPALDDNAIVVGCELNIYINTEGDDLFVYQMLQDWTEASTYTSLGGLPAFDGVDASATPIQELYGLASQTGSVQINIPPSVVQQWVDGENTNGLLLTTGTNTNGFVFRSSEHATSNTRPQLVLRYILAVRTSSITSGEAFGTAVVDDGSDISVTGIASAEQFGTATVEGEDGFITVTGIASAEQFGTAVITGGASNEITVTGIASAEQFGTAAVAAGVALLYSDGVSIGNRSTVLAWQENSDICIARLPANTGHLWLVSDNSENNLMAQRISDGASRGIWSLTGATKADWEALASASVGGTDYLYVGDIGDNNNNRATVTIFRVVEPTITGSDSSTASYEAIACQYPGGNPPTHKDAETLLVDPTNGDMYIITKRDSTAKLYKLAHAASYTGTQTLTYEGTIWTPGFSVDASNDITTGGYYVGGSINNDGSVIVLKNYYTLYAFNRTSNQSIYQALQHAGEVIPAYVGGTRPCGFPNNETKGEAVCFDADDNLYTASEYMAAYTSGSHYPTFKYTRNAQPSVSASFQEGVNGYSGTSDTYIQSAPANQSTNRGGDTTIIADYNTGTDERFALIKFDLSSLPDNILVVGCDLELYIDQEGDDLFVYQMLQSWTESSTYTSLGGLPAFDGVDASAQAIQSVYGLEFQTGGTLFLNIPNTVVQQWVDGTNTQGLVMMSGTNINGFQFRSSEHATTNTRPRLTIRYIALVTASIDDIVADVTDATGSIFAEFVVTLTGPATWAYTIDYDTVDGTALAGEDYVADSGTITFNIGETSKSIFIEVLPDALGESQFSLVLSNPSIGVELASGSAGSSTSICTIVDNILSDFDYSAYSGFDPNPDDFTFEQAFFNMSASEFIDLLYDESLVVGPFTSGADVYAYASELVQRQQPEFELDMFNPAGILSFLIIDPAIVDTDGLTNESIRTLIDYDINAVEDMRSRIRTIFNNDRSKLLTPNTINAIIARDYQSTITATNSKRHLMYAYNDHGLTPNVEYIPDSSGESEHSIVHQGSGPYVLPLTSPLSTGFYNDVDFGYGSMSHLADPLDFANAMAVLPEGERAMNVSHYNVAYPKYRLTVSSATTNPSGTFKLGYRGSPVGPYANLSFGDGTDDGITYGLFRYGPTYSTSLRLNITVGTHAIGDNWDNGFTIAFWHNQGDEPVGTVQDVFRIATTTFRILWDSGTLFRFYWNTASNSGNHTVTLGTLAPNTWYFITLRYNFTSNTLIWYVIKDNETIYTSTSGALHASSKLSPISGFTNISFGNGVATSYRGTLDSFGLWERYLSNAELYEDADSVYNSGFGKQYIDLTTEQLSSLAVWFDFEESGTSTRVDATGNGHDLTLLSGTALDRARGVVTSRVNLLRRSDGIDWADLGYAAGCVIHLRDTVANPNNGFFTVDYVDGQNLYIATDDWAFAESDNNAIVEIVEWTDDINASHAAWGWLAVGVVGPFTPNVQFNAGTNTIVRPSGSWSSDGFRNGKTIVVSNSTSNNGTYTISAISSLTITVSSSLTTETSATATFTSPADSQLRITIRKALELGNGETFSVIPPCSVYYASDNNQTEASVPTTRELDLYFHDKSKLTDTWHYTSLNQVGPGVSCTFTYNADGMDTITRSSGDWVADGYTAGSGLRVSSATVAANNGVYLIHSVSSSTLILKRRHHAIFDAISSSTQRDAYKAKCPQQVTSSSNDTSVIFTQTGFGVPMHSHHEVSWELEPYIDGTGLTGDTQVTIDRLYISTFNIVDEQIGDLLDNNLDPSVTEGDRSVRHMKNTNLQNWLSTVMSAWWKEYKDVGGTVDHMIMDHEDDVSTYYALSIHVDYIGTASGSDTPQGPWAWRGFVRMAKQQDYWPHFTWISQWIQDSLESETFVDETGGTELSRFTPQGHRGFWSRAQVGSMLYNGIYAPCALHFPNVIAGNWWHHCYDYSMPMLHGRVMTENGMVIAGNAQGMAFYGGGELWGTMPYVHPMTPSPRSYGDTFLPQSTVIIKSLTRVSGIITIKGWTKTEIAANKYRGNDQGFSGFKIGHKIKFINGQSSNDVYFGNGLTQVNLTGRIGPLAVHVTALGGNRARLIKAAGGSWASDGFEEGWRISIFNAGSSLFSGASTLSIVAEIESISVTGDDMIIEAHDEYTFISSSNNVMCISSACTMYEVTEVGAPGESAPGGSVDGTDPDIRWIRVRDYGVVSNLSEATLTVSSGGRTTRTFMVVDDHVPMPWYSLMYAIRGTQSMISSCDYQFGATYHLEVDPNFLAVYRAEYVIICRLQGVKYQNQYSYGNILPTGMHERFWMIIDKVLHELDEVVPFSDITLMSLNSVASDIQADDYAVTGAMLPNGTKLFRVTLRPDDPFVDRSESGNVDIGPIDADLNHTYFRNRNGAYIKVPGVLLMPGTDITLPYETYIESLGLQQIGWWTLQQ